ncbi:MAG: tRNA preQ1(34) S-adenosylmethionine ribosyltransferase-isomerase QueA [Acidobacteriota bacterium]
MRPSDFDFELPDDLIAQQPAERREGSKMLVVDRETATLTDSCFSEFPGFLRPDDLLVINNTRVFPARLFGTSETGAKVEVFLARETTTGEWEALARPARRLHVGKRITFGPLLAAVVTGKLSDGKIVIRFENDGDLASLIDQYGRTPLPPYIRRDRDAIDRDRERYQTVYAKNRGAIAAPTAGLHFTPDVLDRIRSQGTEVAEVTLHVGYGTFEPIRAEDLADHRVMAEQYEIEAAAAARLSQARPRGRVIAVGTTTTRALESNFAKYGCYAEAHGQAELTITPGYEFRAVDALLTNFHLPQSSLLVLTSTFGGHELIMDAYRHAVANSYRFYSYGDCMLIL